MAGGMIAMPTHSYCYPSAQGAGRLFDSGETPSVVGAISDTFWRQPGVARSLHPTHSLACEGQGADALSAGHEDCDTPCGRGTPYERLIEQDAAVLMFGATMDSYTFFHTAEDAAAVPYLYEPQPVKLTLRGPEGDEREMVMRRHDMTITRRFKEMDRWLEARCLLRRVTLGRGELLLLPHSRQVHEAIIDQLRCDPWFLAAPHST
jgi:aminoglycoside 3-N-acetyltransferase